MLHLGKCPAVLQEQKKQKAKALSPSARTAPSLAHTIQALRRIRDPRKAPRFL
jgi:hypothetical protein